jgi:GT2 family glycosyltransferase
MAADASAARGTARSGVTPRVSVVIVAYDSGEVLSRCLRSLRVEAPDEVIVVDNGGGLELGEGEASASVEILSPGKNVGFAAGCNLGAGLAQGEVLVFLNPDTVVAPGALAALGATLEDRSVGIAMARLRLLDRPELLNSGGNVLHITGLAWAGGYGEPAASLTTAQEVAFPSGAAMAIRAELFRELGGFTEKLFMYMEDLELGWRTRLRGLRVVVVPQADVYHDYEFARHEGKSYLLERNRLVFVLSAFSLRLLMLLAPLLVSTELAMLPVAARGGWLRGKLAGWGWCVRNGRWLLQHRRQTQSLRRVRDRELAGFMTARLDPRMLELPPFVRFANPLVEAYWALARRAL